MNHGLAGPAVHGSASSSILRRALVGDLPMLEG
jgi:hypothetical protein